MNLSRLVLVSLCAVCLASSAMAADTPESFDLRDGLSTSQIHQAGLDKLSPAELAALNAVTARYSGTRSFDLRDVMTVSQYHQAGLDKLSPDEIAALNAAVSQGPSASTTAATPAPAAPAPMPVPAVAAAAPSVPMLAPAAPATPAPPAVSNASFGKEMMAQVAADAPETLTSTLPGRFRGWNGNAVFRLADGQVWVQAGPGMFETDLQNPTVIIKRLKFGYLLTVPGQTQTVFVRRIH